MTPISNFQAMLAPLAVLLLLGAGGLTVTLTAAAGFLALSRRLALCRKVAIAAATVPVLYGAALLAFSLTSRETTLPAGGEKYFCEIDCHLAYAVTATRVDLAPSGRGRRIAVSLRTRFDERTISPQRGDGPLQPNPRFAEVIDGKGRRFGLTNRTAAEAALGKPLRPGERYETEMFFDVPPDARDLRLRLVESDWLTHLLLGHETSPFHGQTLLALQSAEL